MGSNRFIVAHWQTPFVSILSRLLQIKGCVSWAWNGVWLGFPRLNEDKGTLGELASLPVVGMRGELKSLSWC